MPNYNYECKKCHHIFEVTVSIQDMEKGVFTCKKCGSQDTRRLFDGFGYCNRDGNNNHFSENHYAAPT